MCPLRRVEGDRAGPCALGLLVPPGPRTFLILRPRALAWDLVLLQGPEKGDFRVMSRAEAEAAARDLFGALEGWAGRSAAGGCLEDVSNPEGGFFVRARVGPFVLLACPRRAGEPYRPAVFSDADAALEAAMQLRAVLCPARGVEQECYFNTRHFDR